MHSGPHLLARPPRTASINAYLPTAACARVAATSILGSDIRTEEYPEVWREWIAMLTLKAGGTA